MKVSKKKIHRPHPPGEDCDICAQQKHSPIPSRTEVDILRQKIIDIIGKNPDKAALILAHWIHSSKK
jgi:hypothetical protein